MTQALADASPFPSRRRGVVAAFLRWLGRAGRGILRLATDGLLADAFLVTAGDRFVAVLLRRPDGAYAVDVRDADATTLAAASSSSRRWPATPSRASCARM